MIDSRRLRQFVAVAEEENFARAGERLHVAIPSVWRHVQELQQELAAPLFERDQRNVKLTACGRMVLSESRRIVSEFDRTVARIRQIASGDLGTLSVGLTETAPWTPEIPKCLQSFRSRFPAIEIGLDSASSNSLEERVRDKTLDCAFVSNIPVDPELAHLPVAELHVLLAIPTGHRLQNRNIISLADLTDESFIWFPRTTSTTYYDGLMQGCAAGGLVPKVVHEAAMKPSC